MDNNQADPKKVFIGNLPWSMSQQDVQNMASEYGTVVDCHLPLDPQGRSRGIAFVTYEKEEEASAAIEGIEGREEDGRSLHASVAKPRGERRSNDRRPRRQYN